MSFHPQGDNLCNKNPYFPWGSSSPKKKEKEFDMSFVCCVACILTIFLHGNLSDIFSSHHNLGIILVRKGKNQNKKPITCARTKTLCYVNYIWGSLRILLLEKQSIGARQFGTRERRSMTRFETRDSDIIIIKYFSNHHWGTKRFF